MLLLLLLYALREKIISLFYRPRQTTFNIQVWCGWKLCFYVIRNVWCIARSFLEFSRASCSWRRDIYSTCFGKVFVQVASLDILEHHHAKTEWLLLLLRPFLLQCNVSTYKAVGRCKEWKGMLLQFRCVRCQMIQVASWELFGASSWKQVMIVHPRGWIYFCAMPIFCFFCMLLAPAWPWPRWQKVEIMCVLKSRCE